MNCSVCKAPGMCVCSTGYVHGRMSGGWGEGTHGGQQMPKDREIMRLPNFPVQQAAATRVLGQQWLEGSFMREAATPEEAEEFRTKTYTIEMVNDQTGESLKRSGIRPVEVSPGVFQFRLRS